MNQLFQEWKKCTLALFTKALPSFFEKSFCHYLSTLKTFFKYFGWLFIPNALLMLFWGKEILDVSNFLTNISSTNATLDQTSVLIYFLEITICFILAIGFFLTIRRPNSVSLQYYKIGFFRYIQISLFFSFTFFFIVNMLFSLGISNFPKLHWIIVLSIKLAEKLTIFYWLDSNFKFKDIITSLESALNLILYKSPFFIMLFGIWGTINYLLSFVLDGFKASYDFHKLLSGVSCNKFYEITISNFSLASIAKLLAIKYFFFLFNFFFITLLFVYYSLRKNEHYVDSIFETNDV